MEEETSKKEPGEKSPAAEEKSEKEASGSKSSPVRLLTFVVLLISVLFFAWYVLSDRFTPYTDQARFNGLMVPIVASV